MKSFFLKSLMLLSFALLMSFTAKSQDYYNITITNNSTCDLNVQVLGPGGIILATYLVTAGSTSSPTCQTGQPVSFAVYPPGSPGCNIIFPPQALSVSCNPSGNCCGCVTGLTVTAAQTGPTTPPTPCGALGRLYVQTITIN